LPPVTAAAIATQIVVGPIELSTPGDERRPAVAARDGSPHDGRSIQHRDGQEESRTHAALTTSPAQEDSAPFRIGLGIKRPLEYSTPASIFRTDSV
jgi:hypothetical protein